MVLRMTRKWLFPALLVGGVVAACHDVAGPRTGDISLLISVSHAEASALAAVEQWTATVLGVTGKSATGAPGETVTIGGLAPGSYDVVCEGTEGNAVTYVDTASATVQAGSNTPVTVVPTAVVYDIEITPGTDTLTAIGDTTRLEAGVKEPGGTAVPNATLRWSAGGAGVATVNSSGLVTAVSTGVETITASLGENSATAAVHVRQVAAGATSTITPEPASIPADGASTSVITVRLKDANGHDLTAGDDSVELATTAGTLSPPEDNGDGSYSATLTASSLAGSATISGTVNGSEIVNDASVTFTTIVALVVVTPDGASLTGVGAMQTFTAEARDSAGNVLASAPVTWSSLNPNVATIDGSTGEATAVGAGQVTIAANAEGVVGYGLLTVAVPGMEPVNLWSVMSSPTSVHLFSVWGTSSSNVFVTGQDGTILHFDGSAWTTMSNSEPANLIALWGTSASDVYAVGSSILHYDGTVWTTMGEPVGLGQWGGVWGTSPRNVYAVGSDAGILHYDGNAWSSMSSPTAGPVREVWGISTSDVYAVGEDGADGVVLHSDGSVWSVTSRPSTGQLHGVWGTSASDIFAVGRPGFFRYDGTVWSSMDEPGYNAHDVCGTSSSEVYVAGDGIHGPGIFRYDGVAWSVAWSAQDDEIVWEVWASPDADVFAVGLSGTIVRGYRGASVVVAPGTPTLAALGDTVRLTAQAEDSNGDPVSGVSITSWNSSDESVATVDTEGLVTAVSNGVATISASATGGASGSAQITVAQAAVTIQVTPHGATIATAGGTQAFTGAAWDANGNLIPGKTFTWSTLNPNVATIDGGIGMATAVASGQVTVAAEADGAVGYSLLTVAVPGMEPVNLWSVMQSPTNAGLTSVWGVSSSDVYAAGEGTILHYDGSMWSSMSIPWNEYLPALWGSSLNDVYAAGWEILHYDGGEWSIMSSPHVDQVLDLWGTSPVDVFAVGRNGMMLHYDGSAWSIMNSPTTGHINDLWGFSSSDVYAVGADGSDAAILHYGGSSWSVVSRQSNGELYGIWGASAGDIHSVGHPAMIFHYDGNAWSDTGNPEQYGANGVWGACASDVYAADGPSDRILRYDGAAWSIPVSGTNIGYVQDVWVSPDYDVFAVGNTGTIVRGYRGAGVAVTPGADTITAVGDTVRFTAQAQDAAGNPVGGVPLTLWSSSDLNVATVDTEGLVTAVSSGFATITVTAPGGASGSAEIVVDQAAATIEVTPHGATIATAGGNQTFSGIAWDANGHLIPGKTFTWSTLNPNIAEIDPFTGLASPVGSGQVTIVAEADGAVGYGLLTVAVPGMEPVNLWSMMESPTIEVLKGVWGSAASDVYAVGNAGVILHYDGSEWSMMSSPEVSNLHTVWGTSSNDIHAVGGPLFHYDGSSWRALSGGDSWNGVWGTSPTDAYAVGFSQTTLIHYDGSGWSPMSSPTLEDMNDVWGFSSEDVYGVSGEGAVLRYNGSAWSVVSRPASWLNAIWGTSASDLYAVGDGILHYDGSTWSSMSFPGDAGSAVWGTSSSDVYAVGDNILHYDGSIWNLMSRPATVSLSDVWASPDSDVFAVGDSGTILRGIRGAIVRLTATTATLTTLGDTVRISAIADDSHGDPVSGVTFTWSSSDEGVATVDTTGLVTAVANGVATITVTASGGAADSAEITVDQPAPTIDVEAAGTTVRASGSTHSFTAAARNVRATSISEKLFARTRFTTGHH
jgi:uncharacterized protein YjdB